jgi:uracil-DNA glycosylase
MKKHDEMKKIRDELTPLTESPLYSYRTENNYLPVIGEGSHDASIMFIGEAPGKNEAKTGMPFCGAAGKILDELLASISVSRESVFVTNIVKDRPPENRDPAPSEIDMYAQFLDRQIEIIQPKVLATLGRFSMGYIMKKFDLELELEPISIAHGKTYIAQGQGSDIVIAPQYHPAAAIYNQSLKDTLIKDFQVLRQFI